MNSARLPERAGATVLEADTLENPPWPITPKQNDWLAVQNGRYRPPVVMLEAAGAAPPGALDSGVTISEYQYHWLFAMCMPMVTSAANVEVPPRVQVTPVPSV